MKNITALLLIPFLLMPLLAEAYKSNYCTTCERDGNGHIKRSLEAKHEFKRQHPCPSTGKSKGRCEGYIIDHVIPLKRGGPDVPSNMQWQTIEESKAKDSIE
ncbi:MAG: HNH endonuclease signature motif containing protein [Methylotenera sp.]